MNKYQQALDSLKEKVENISGLGIESDNEFYDWIETLQELVEKETPKKVEKGEEHYMPESYELDYVECYCPTCGELYYVGEDELKNINYCIKCGQRLDWSDKDD